MRTDATKRSELVVSPSGMWDGQWGRIQKSHAGCGRDSSVEPRNRNLTRSAKLRVSGKTKPHVDPKWKAPFLRITKTQTMSLKLERTPVFFASGRCGPVLTFAGARQLSAAATPSTPPEPEAYLYSTVPNPGPNLLSLNASAFAAWIWFSVATCWRETCISSACFQSLHTQALLQFVERRGHSKDSKLIEDVGSMVYGCLSNRAKP